MFDTLPYREIWAVDFEFRSEARREPGARVPGCMGIAQRSQVAPMAATSSVLRRRIRPAPTCCSSRTTPAQKSVVISLSAGQCRSACWTCSPSSATTRMACPRPAARVARRACLSRAGWHRRRRERQNARPGLARRPMVGRRTRGNPRLLRNRCGGAGAAAARHVAEDRLAARPTAGPLHGGSRTHGTKRRTH